MADRFTPRNFLVAPSLFGNLQANWRPWETEDELFVARAWFQHLFVGRIFVAIEEDTDGIEDFAVHAGTASRTIKDKLSGRQPIGIDDLVTWSFLLGVDKYPRVEQRGDLLPPPDMVRTDVEADVVPMARSKEGA
jgi:hypothetical protein